MHKRNVVEIAVENGEDAILTKPIVSYLAEPSTIDTLFGYTSAVINFSLAVRLFLC